MGGLFIVYEQYCSEGEGDVKQRLFQVQCSLDFNVELG